MPIAEKLNTEKDLSEGLSTMTCTFFRDVKYSCNGIPNNRTDHHCRSAGVSLPVISFFDADSIKATSSFPRAGLCDEQGEINSVQGAMERNMETAPKPSSEQAFALPEEIRSYAVDHPGLIGRSSLKECTGMVNSECAKTLNEHGLINGRFMLAIKFHLLHHASFFQFVVKPMRFCKGPWSAVALKQLNAAAKARNESQSTINPALAVSSLRVH